MTKLNQHKIPPSRINSGKEISYLKALDQRDAEPSGEKDPRERKDGKRQ